MPTIDTLIPDIYELISKDDQRSWLDESNSSYLSEKLRSEFERKDVSPERRGLRLSRLGMQCPCALWHSVHKPDLAESLPPWAQFKYAYGHIIEALTLALAKQSGHEVIGEQDEVVVDGVTGHRDCVIDGCVVDVKSVSSRQYPKFKDGSLAHDDSFGYLDQLDGYLVGSLGDDLVRTKDRGYILAVDKTLGHMCLYEHRLRFTPDGTPTIKQRIEQFKEIVGRSSPPACNCKTISDGKSGNYRLDTRASYSLYKHCCFPNLRTFFYAGGPVYLTKVVRKPDVIEVDRYGKVVYN